MGAVMEISGFRDAEVDDRGCPYEQFLRSYSRYL